MQSYGNFNHHSYKFSKDFIQESKKSLVKKKNNPSKRHRIMLSPSPKNLNLNFNSNSNHSFNPKGKTIKKGK